MVAMGHHVSNQMVILAASEAAIKVVEAPLENIFVGQSIFLSILIILIVFKHKSDPFVLVKLVLRHKGPELVLVAPEGPLVDEEGVVGVEPLGGREAGPGWMVGEGVRGVGVADEHRLHVEVLLLQLLRQAGKQLPQLVLRKIMMIIF